MCSLHSLRHQGVSCAVRETRCFVQKRAHVIARTRNEAWRGSAQGELESRFESVRVGAAGPRRQDSLCTPSYNRVTLRCSVSVPPRSLSPPRLPFPLASGPPRARFCLRPPWPCRSRPASSCPSRWRTSTFPARSPSRSARASPSASSSVAWWWKGQREAGSFRMVRPPACTVCCRHALSRTRRRLGARLRHALRD